MNLRGRRSACNLFSGLTTAAVSRIQYQRVSTDNAVVEQNGGLVVVHSSSCAPRQLHSSQSATTFPRSARTMRRCMAKALPLCDVTMLGSRPIPSSRNQSHFCHIPSCCEPHCSAITTQIQRSHNLLLSEERSELRQQQSATFRRNISLPSTG
jgi:hypothetical protein